MQTQFGSTSLVSVPRHVRQFEGFKSQEPHWKSHGIQYSSTKLSKVPSGQSQFPPILSPLQTKQESERPAHLAHLLSQGRQGALTSSS
jgi:hypothetical protein